MKSPHRLSPPPPTPPHRKIWNSFFMDTCGEQLKSGIKMSVFGGVEGGATHSTLVLFNEKSEALTTVEGPGTNLFLNGMDETCHRIAEMICQALKNLGKFHSDKSFFSNEEYYVFF